jgi:hypothetical protein
MNNRKTFERIMNAVKTIERKANVAGYVILDNAGEHIGTVRLSYPRDGAGKLVAVAANWTAVRPRDEKGEPNFSTWSPWQYGWANGGGYDKATAALGGMTIGTCTLQDQGKDWTNQLRDAGYRVINAV